MRAAPRALVALVFIAVMAYGKGALVARHELLAAVRRHPDVVSANPADLPVRLPERLRLHRLIEKIINTETHGGLPLGSSRRTYPGIAIAADDDALVAVVGAGD